MKITIAASLACLMFVHCKEKTAASSEAKDFAAVANAKNFVIIAGFVPDTPGQPMFGGLPSGVFYDNYNWKNVLVNRKDLGNFELVYEDTKASSVGLIAAFKKVGEQLEADSTVVFVFTGIREGESLRTSDTPDSLVSLTTLIQTAQTAAKGRSGQRLFILEDVIPNATTLHPDFKPFNYIGSPAVKSLFKEVIGVEARSAFSRIPKGRLAYEFAILLDKEVRSPQQMKMNDFFDGVVSAIGQSTNPPALFQASDVKILEQTLLANANQTQKSKSKAASQTNGGSGTGQNSAKQTNGASGKNSIIELSLSYCGPCADMARRLSVEPMVTGGACGVKTFITFDPASGQTGEIELAQWNEMVMDAKVKDHSEAASNADLEKNYPQVPSGGGYPKVFVVDGNNKFIKMADEDSFSDCSSGSGNSNGSTFNKSDLGDRGLRPSQDD
jgi:hypothetical protein